MRFLIDVNLNIQDQTASVVLNVIRKELAAIVTNQGIIMSAISDYATAQTEHNARMDAALTGLSGDITALNAKITELQNSPGAITPADQLLLDDLQAQAEALATRIEAADALTPPVAPPVPTV